MEKQGMKLDLGTKMVDRIVRPAEAVIMTGRSLASIWRDEKAGTFPRKHRIGQKAVGYRLSELQSWMDSLATVTADNIVPVAPGSAKGRKPRNAGMTGGI